MKITKNDLIFEIICWSLAGIAIGFAMEIALNQWIYPGFSYLVDDFAQTIYGSSASLFMLFFIMLYLKFDGSLLEYILGIPAWAVILGCIASGFIGGLVSIFFWGPIVIVEEYLFHTSVVEQIGETLGYFTQGAFSSGLVIPLYNRLPPD